MTENPIIRSVFDTEMAKLQKELEQSQQTLRIMQWFLHIAMHYQQLGLPLPDCHFEDALELLEMQFTEAN